MAIGGKLRESQRTLRVRIADAMEHQGVSPRLAARIALQLVMKCRDQDLAASSTWSDIGDLICRDANQLRLGLGLVERQIVVALPKLSATQIEALLMDLRAEDPSIARTVINAALDAAEPVAAARRYMDQFHEVLEQLRHIDPDTARSFANASFMARSPHRTAMEHFRRFREVVESVWSDVPFARTVARVACRAPDPAVAAERFVAIYYNIVGILAAAGTEVAVARSLASIASLGAKPVTTARTLLERYKCVLDHVRTTHPAVARSIALAACRSRDPLAMANRYMNGYDTVVRSVERTDRRRAHTVASLAFDSAKPLQAAERYLKQLQECR